MARLGLGMMAGALSTVVACSIASAEGPRLGTSEVLGYNRALCEAVGTLHATLTRDLGKEMREAAVFPSFTAETHPLNWTANLVACVGTSADPSIIVANLKNVGLDVAVPRMEVRRDLAGTRAEWASLGPQYEALLAEARRFNVAQVSLPASLPTKPEQRLQIEVLEGWRRLESGCGGLGALYAWEKKSEWIQSELDKLSSKTDDDGRQAYLYALRLFLDLGNPPAVPKEEVSPRVAESKGASASDEEGESVDFGPALVEGGGWRGGRMSHAEVDIEAVKIGFGAGNPYLAAVERIYWASVLEQVHVDFGTLIEQRLDVSPRKRGSVPFDAEQSFRDALETARTNFSRIEFSPEQHQKIERELRLPGAHVGYDFAVLRYLDAVLAYNQMDLVRPEGKWTAEQEAQLLGLESMCPWTIGDPSVYDAVSNYSEVCNGFNAQAPNFSQLFDSGENAWEGSTASGCLIEPSTCSGALYDYDKWGTSEDPRWKIVGVLR